jgi:bifunctional UDP-N-acetylglucosamine pyrophosphorylase/glucosamine-1-phosphate N-acetyltransferase
LQIEGKKAKFIRHLIIIMKILLLAAGRSKRMAPIQDKNFLDFCGKSLIERQIELIKSACEGEIVIVYGSHNMDKVNMTASKYKNVSVVEQKNLDEGMCGAILACEKIIGKEPVLIFSGNDVVERHALELVLKDKDKQADSLIIGKKVNKYFPGGYLEVDKNGWIKNIIEKPDEGKEPSDMINLVVHLHKNSSALIANLKKVSSKNDDKYEVALLNMIKSGVKMKAIKYDGVWMPIKFPWHIHDAFRYFFSKEKKVISKKSIISKNAVIKGDVIICDNVKVMDGAFINGPCYIGEGSVIATNALVRESHIGNSCVIGFSTEVARSYLADNVWTHSNYIGDSIISSNVSFGAGTVTGNLRLDEKNILVDVNGKKFDTNTNKFGLICGKNVRFGINTSIMPGVRVYEDCFIGAGLVIPYDIPKKSYVKGKIELEIKENKSSADMKSRENIKKKL